MGLRGIHGKPGSGKSCYAVDMIVKMMFDWARYKRNKGETYPRKLYTNIPLFIDEINDYMTGELCFKVDMSENLVLLDDKFFRNENGGFREWWEDFEEKAFIVIDEVQFYLPATVRKKGGDDYADRWMEYISTHRHRQQDIILMSQSIDNVTVEVRRQMEVIYEVLNVKNTTVGRWPFTMPMQDIDVVREAWGLPQQFAHIKRGVCEAKSVKYDKAYEAFLLRPALFRLYRSHTKSTEALDRPSLKLGKLGSILWLARRHGFRLLFWVAVAISTVFAFRNFVSTFPAALVESLVPPTVESKETPDSSPVRVIHPEKEEASVSAKTDADDKILGFVRGGVITPRGVLRSEDHITIEGEKDFVKSVDVVRGILYLGSGKKVQK